MEEGKKENAEEKDFNKENTIKIKEEKEIAKDKEQKQRKKKLSKKVKLVVAIIIITVAIGVAVYILTPKKPYTTVGDVISNLDYYKDKNIEVKGTVKDLNSTNSTGYVFNLTDGKNVLKVEYKKAIPPTFEVGKEVVVSGKLVNKNNEWIFEASEIQVGCPSKYE